jgi:hypothetical protein
MGPEVILRALLFGVTVLLSSEPFSLFARLLHLPDIQNFEASTLEDQAKTLATCAASKPRERPAFYWTKKRKRKINFSDKRTEAWSF